MIVKIVKVLLLILFSVLLFISVRLNIHFYLLQKNVKEDIFYYKQSLKYYRAQLAKQKKDATGYRIQDEVEKIRGLSFLSKVEFHKIDKSELQEIIIRQIEKEIKKKQINIEDYVKVLMKFGFIEQHIDLNSKLMDIYVEQVQGMYDEKLKKMILIEDVPLSAPLHEMFLAHELTHALQDQRFDLSNFLDVDNTDEELARMAVLEGDAVQVMFKYYLQHLKIKKLFWDIYKYLSVNQAELYEAPYFIQQTLLFPYVWGSKFVSGIYNKEGWSGVDRLYKMPPVSSEQILHPSKYPHDKPKKVQLAKDIGLSGNWRLVDTDVMGEFYIRVLLSIYMEEDVAAYAAQGWEGDLWRIWENEDGKLYLIWKSKWETRADANNFANSMRAVFEKRGIDGKIVPELKEVVVEY